MEQMIEKPNKIPDILKISIMVILMALYWTLSSTYFTLNDADGLIKLAAKGNTLVKIPSNIDKVKLKQAYENDPIKLIYDPNFSYLSKVNGKINEITIFFEFNPFTQQCEMTSRVSGIWKFLDTFSETGPFYLNIRSFKIDTDYCNMIYGYHKIHSK